VAGDGDPADAGDHRALSRVSEEAPCRHAILRRAETLLAHDADLPEDPVVPPIYQTSLFTYRSYRDMADSFAGRVRRPIYSRGDNPTVMEFERRVAALEFAEAARGFSSGMAAISATVLAFAGSGDRIVVVNHVYGDAYRFFQRLLPALGITVEYVDGCDTAAVERALPGARLLYLETPTSMVFDLQDLPRLATAARAAGAVTVADNSWATPLFQQPKLHGVDLVLHSASKYLGGHSDTVAGVVAGPVALVERINARTYPYLGAKLSPFEGWLLLRGLRTLPLRLPRHERSARILAERLREHPNVARVLHPAFSNHPGRATLLGTTGLFSFETDEGIDIPAFVDALRLFRIGVSWGGHESLVCPAKATLEQTPSVNSLARFGVTPRTVRLHVGLEDVEDLWNDLAEALARARR
jgi:cystathionine beta-lyase/cystathionine gamma-synthase